MTAQPFQHESLGMTTGHDRQGPREAAAVTMIQPDAEVTVWNYGARLVSFEVPERDGGAVNVVRRLPTLASYEADKAFVGATMGRYARAVAHGRCRVAGQDLTLDRNLGGHHFHGGSIGFDQYVWELETGQDRETLFVRFRLVSADGDQGYRGTVTAWATYRLSPGRVLEINFEAITDAPTLVGLSPHAFWSMAPGGLINDQVLGLTPRRFVATDADHIPNGPLVDVAGTPQDFTSGRRIGEQMLDLCYVTEADGLAELMTLTDPASGRCLTVTSDQPGLAIYSGERLDPPRSGLCIQPSALPDAPNQPEFPSVQLLPGKTYRSWSRFEVRG